MCLYVLSIGYEAHWNSQLCHFPACFLESQLLFTGCKAKEELRLGDIFFLISNEYACIFLLHHVTLLSIRDLNNQNSSLLPWLLSRFICILSIRCLFKCHTHLFLLRILASWLSQALVYVFCVARRPILWTTLGFFCCCCFFCNTCN